jgi:ribosomal protein S18 acetylase RimI-like enzyme
MSANDVEIEFGIAEKYMTQAAEIYYDAFRVKLASLKGSEERVVALLAKIFNPQQGIVAIQEGLCVGLVGLHFNGQYFTKIKAVVFVEGLGWFYGLMGYLAFHAFEPKIAKDEMRIECLAVAPDKRSQGIGTLLLAKVDEFTRAKGFNTVRLEVVDTNPNAQRLYERQGFQVTRTQHYPLFRSLAGYSAVDTMIKKLV